MAGIRLGRAPLSRIRLFRSPVRVRAAFDQGGPRLRRQLDARGNAQLRGTLTEAGTRQPVSASASVEENLDLFRRMKEGEFPDGAHVLRLKIDLASPNMNLRDPAIYRIRHVSHHRTGDKWCVYPLYDYTHCISDALERITHSICTLEFQDHRPLYDWVIERLAEAGLLQRPLPQQYEFARLNLTLHRDEQAPAPRTCRRRLRGRLGRPAHAHTRGACAAAAIRRNRFGSFAERIGVSKARSVDRHERA